MYCTRSPGRQCVDVLKPHFLDFIPRRCYERVKSNQGEFLFVISFYYFVLAFPVVTLFLL